MRYGAGCVLFGLGAASTLAVMAAALEASVAASPAAHGGEPISVNRTFKGDRSPALPGASRVIPAPEANEPALPEGCIAASDWRSHVYSDEVAGRCVV
jgi:hypothetical protein